MCFLSVFLPNKKAQQNIHLDDVRVIYPVTAMLIKTCTAYRVDICCACWQICNGRWSPIPDSFPTSLHPERPLCSSGSRAFNRHKMEMWKTWKMHWLQSSRNPFYCAANVDGRCRRTWFRTDPGRLRTGSHTVEVSLQQDLLVRCLVIHNRNGTVALSWLLDSVKAAHFLPLCAVCLSHYKSSRNSQDMTSVTPGWGALYCKPVCNRSLLGT